MNDNYEPTTLEQQKEASQSGSSTIRAAVALHLAGADWDIIATRCAYSSPQTARVAVEKFLGETYTASDLTSARNRARARYDRLLQSVWPDATRPFEFDAAGNQTGERNEAHMAALDRARALIGDLARLDGLNAPSQLQVYVPGSDEIMAVVATLRQAKLEGIAQEADPFGEEIVVPLGEEED